VTDSKLKEKYEGSKFTIIHCDGAIKSFHKALGSVDARQRKSFTRAIIHQINRLANGHRMSKESFPQEGDLPKRPGQHHTKKFNALKRIPIRGYCWLSELHEHTYFISHYITKKKDKLDSSDTTLVGHNWERIEVDEHER
jgi:hypothetical protein